jgi:hypothetical protein
MYSIIICTDFSAAISLSLVLNITSKCQLHQSQRAGYHTESSSITDKSK